MITRIEVDGFKSLRDFAVDLEPFTVLIGPNSAGKSNLLDAIALLSRLASQPIADAFKQGRGKSIDQFSRRGSEVAKSIRFAVEILAYGDYPPSQPTSERKDTFQSRFRHELTIERSVLRSGAERLVARHVSLRAMRREEDTWMPAHPELAAYAGYEHGGDELDNYWLKDQGDEHNFLSSIRVLDSGAAILGKPSERIDSGELLPDASNLPTILAELPPNVLGGIRADLVSLVTGIASFDVSPAEDEIRLDFELSGGERMPARLVSAGTLRILALLTALRTEPRPFLLCIEEPENGIYPGRLRALLQLLCEATTRSHEEDAREAFEANSRDRGDGALQIFTNQLPTQILLTTHSPVALATLRSHPQSLRFVDMVRRDRERITRVRTVAQPGAGDRGRTTISLHEIDALLQAVQSEEPV
jgi:predicted ATPase